MADGGRMLKLKAFLNAGQSREVTLTEFKEFWQACSPEERDQFCREAGIA